LFLFNDNYVIPCVRFGTSSSRAKDISKNCPKADRLWNGVETADNLWFKRTEEPGRNQKEADSYKARMKDDDAWGDD
jgi:hypothetical protein